MIEVALSLVVAVVLLTAMVIQLWRARRRNIKGAEQLRLAVAEGQTIPLSLHPVIDPALCVGSFSCIKACPEGEIIGVVDGVATLVEAAHCIGHGRCAVECPVGAIKLVFGTAEMGIDLPKADEEFESSRAGVFIIGELGGMGLIKNALRQGLVVGNVLKKKLKKSQATEHLSDVVVVGGGPAGIACAVACREQGLDVRILEQDTLGGCIAHYPRGKVVMTEQIVMPGYGPFGRSLLSKEELLADMRTLIVNNNIHIEEGQRVTGILGEEGDFTVVTATNATVKGRAVVLAIGLRGTPRKLGVPGEELPKVLYRLVEPEQYHGKRVLIVGGGDSAVEAAIQLAEESTAKVAISYRQGQFARCKQRNKEKIARLIAEGHVQALFKTKVVGIEEGAVRIAPILDDKELAELRREEELRAAAELIERAAAERDAAAEKAEREKERERSQKSRSRPLAAPTPAPATDPETTADPDVTDPLGRRNFDTREDKHSITGSLRALPLDGAPARPPTPDDKKLGEPSSSIRSVGPAQVRRRESDVHMKRREKSEKVPAAENRGRPPVTRPLARPADERTRTIMAPLPPTVPDNRADRKGEPVTSSSAAAGRRDEGKRDREPGEQKLKNDTVIVSIGGQLPTEFLKNVGVGTRNYRGEERSGFDKQRPDSKRPTKAQVEARSRRRLAMTLTLLGISIIIGLVLIGQEYYWLPLELRAESPLHPLLKPSGLWGHGVGVAATAFMMANFLYALRKRWRKLKGSASIRTWLTFHMFVGIMSPLVIAFHAAFLVNNLLAVWTWIALSVVVGTGVFGRFLFSFVPAQAGKVLAVSELREKVNDMTRVIQPHMAEATDFVRVNNILTRAQDGPREKTLVGAVVRDRRDRRELEKNIDDARGLFKEESAFKVYKQGVLEIGRAKMQLSFYGGLKRVFRMWLVVHVIVSLFMVVLIGAHVAVTTYLGYTWIFSDAPH